MSVKMSQKYTKTEVWPVAAEIADDVPVLSVSNQPGWTLTGSGAYTKSTTVGPYTVSGIPAGGVGLQALQVTVATDGAFRYNVTGSSASTARNTPVYAVVSGGNVTSLTLAVGSNVLFGKIDRHVGELAPTECSVLIGKGF